jgi:hypothetical protein
MLASLGPQVLHKVWPKVFGVGISSGAIIDQKFYTWFCHSRVGCFEEIAVFYKVWPKVFGVAESNGPMSDQKFCIQFFLNPEQMSIEIGKCQFVCPVSDWSVFPINKNASLSEHRFSTAILLRYSWGLNCYHIGVFRGSPGLLWGYPLMVNYYSQSWKDEYAKRKLPVFLPALSLVETRTSQIWARLFSVISRIKHGHCRVNYGVIEGALSFEIHDAYVLFD